MWDCRSRPPHTLAKSWWCDVKGWPPALGPGNLGLYINMLISLWLGLPLKWDCDGLLCLPCEFVIRIKVKVKALSRVRLFATPWTVAHQAPPSMGFSRQEYWIWLPFPSLGDLPNPGIEPRSPTLQAGALTSEPPAKIRIKCGHKCESALEIVKLSLFSSHHGRGSVCFRV